jgi:hypothetical protein
VFIRKNSKLAIQLFYNPGEAEIKVNLVSWLITCEVGTEQPVETSKCAIGPHLDRQKNHIA